MSFTVTIAGTDRTDKISFNSLRKRDVLNQQVYTCSFDVNRKGAETYEPGIGEAVVVTRDGTTIFGGVILRITERVEASTIITYEVECVDYSQYLKRQLVTERYTSSTVGTIIADLVSSYTVAADSITANNVEGTLAIASFSFDRLTVADCLQRS